ncbi:hypothetical protein ZIOFF_009283 [Zingiber officinale]|uniref:Uncharacterized protein n=1 Tax=Zingiber officinale TaxID=94328 RepID=A0A8J5HKU1_ZINOF|nr:hypothetical protein ZIOFF_009283 [Zingiber officinale]
MRTEGTHQLSTSAAYAPHNLDRRAGPTPSALGPRGAAHALGLKFILDLFFSAPGLLCRRTGAGAAARGLLVTVYPWCRFRFFLKLTCWDSIGGTVLKGEELKLFRAWSGLERGDKFEIWAFGSGRAGELCFAVGRR